jgi:hypothetical protein
LWSPAFQVALAAFGGDRLDFLTAQHPTRVRGPAPAAGVVLSPLRFTTAFGQVSFLEVMGGVGYDAPSLGLSFEARLFEVATLF